MTRRSRRNPRRGGQRLALTVVAGVAAALLQAASSARPAAAYEYWTRARTSGEAYELRGFRLIGDELSITRRRFSQSLALVLYDLGDLERDRRRNGRAPNRGPIVSWHSYLRLDHDFGTFVTGRLQTQPTRRQDALDVIPEIEDTTFALRLLYGHLTVDGLFGGRLSLQLGRIAAFDATGALPIDGVAARVAVAAHVEVRASGGLAVRESSPLAAPYGELDGTSGADCQEYVAAAAGQPGRWQLLDRNRAITDGRYTSDFEYCPQREVRMPTVQLAVASRRFDRIYAEAGYRLARSPTSGVYPDGDAQLPAAPGWGTNLEQLYALAQGRWQRGALALEPRAFVRASLVDSVVDRAELELVISRRRHELAPSISRFVPTFDADSIWSVFGAEPSLDLAVDYRYRGPWQGRAQLWARRYDAGDAWAWGAAADALRPIARRFTASARAFGDAGYGGERLAFHGELRWSGSRTILTGRGAVAWVRGDSATAHQAAPARSGTAAGTATWRLAGGVAVHSMMELSVFSEDTAIRALAIVDFALESER